jgi:linoleoyl-CoA desaturase
LCFHSPLEVFVGYVTVGYVLGATLALVFQLAHSVENVDFLELPPDGERLERAFFDHQIATTANFAPRNPLVTWFVGGLNFQVEHHLFPRVSHRHYPALAKITAQVCREQGVAYHCNETLLGALRAHFGYLKRMGRA